MHPPRVVIVTRPSEYQQLLARHATRQQAAFFLKQRGHHLDEVQARHHLQQAALHTALTHIPPEWRRTQVGRDDLARFLFEPQDIIVAIGQDGLVANLAKYLRGQPVLGVNPDPARYDGILVPLQVDDCAALLPAAAEQTADVEQRTMVEAALDDGQRLVALNELFIGHRTHQSARYQLSYNQLQEHHSSSGVIVSTGTGATGWARSIHRQSKSCLRMPTPEEDALIFFVREAFPSRATGTDVTEGRLERDSTFALVSEMNEQGVIFGDGIEDDRLTFSWGMRVSIRSAESALSLVQK